MGRTWGEGRFVKFFISISGSFGAECDKLPFGDWKGAQAGIIGRGRKVLK